MSREMGLSPLMLSTLRRSLRAVVLFSGVLWLATGAHAQAPPGAAAPGGVKTVSAESASPTPAAPASPAPEKAPAPEKKAAPDPKPTSPSPQQKLGWFWTGEIRIQPEVTDFFKPTPTSENSYGFLGVRMRGDVGYRGKGWDARAQLQNVLVTGIPRGAVAPGYGSVLGQGGVYYAIARRGDIDTLGLRQAWFRIGDPDRTNLQVGRFEYHSAMEVTSKDPVLAWLKWERIAKKTMSTLNYNTWTRTFDGARLDIDADPVRITGVVVHPTQAEAHFATEARSVLVSNLAITTKEKGLLPNSEAQLFWNHYDDTRQVTEPDNRVLRGTDFAEGGNHIDTYGFHYATRLGKEGDAFVWYGHQSGKWGFLTHRADAFQAEVGWQPSNVPWKPWFRVGYSQYSGDNNPNDKVHTTFVAPTLDNRVIVPWWSTVNVHHVIGSLLLNPSTRTKARLDVQSLTLDSSSDSWYIGSGVLQQKGLSGYILRPANGSKDLGRSVVVNLEHRFDDHQRVWFFFERFWGGQVVKAIFPQQSTGTVYMTGYTLTLP